MAAAAGAGVIGVPHARDGGPVSQLGLSNRNWAVVFWAPHRNSADGPIIQPFRDGRPFVLNPRDEDGQVTNDMFAYLQNKRPAPTSYVWQVELGKKATHGLPTERDVREPRVPIDVPAVPADGIYDGEGVMPHIHLMLSFKNAVIGRSVKQILESDTAHVESVRNRQSCFEYTTKDTCRYPGFGMPVCWPDEDTARGRQGARTDLDDIKAWAKQYYETNRRAPTDEECAELYFNELVKYPNLKNVIDMLCRHPRPADTDLVVRCYVGLTRCGKTWDSFREATAAGGEMGVFMKNAGCKWLDGYCGQPSMFVFFCILCVPHHSHPRQTPNWSLPSHQKKHIQWICSLTLVLQRTAVIGLGVPLLLIPQHLSRCLPPVLSLLRAFGTHIGLLMDEMGGQSMPLAPLLQLLDSSPANRLCRYEVKGRMVYVAARTIWVCSNCLPSQWFAGVFARNPEREDALWSRLVVMRVYYAAHTEDPHYVEFDARTSGLGPSGWGAWMKDKVTTAWREHGLPIAVFDAEAQMAHGHHVDE